MHDKASSQQSHKAQDIVVCTCTVCGIVHTLKSFEVTGDVDLGVKIHGCPKIIRFTLVYPGLSTGRFISVVREAVLSVRRDARDARDGLGGLAIRGFLRWRGQNDDGKGPQLS